MIASTNIYKDYKEGKLSLNEVKDKLIRLLKENSKHPLSESQKGLWALQKITPGMSAYNCPICFRIYDGLNLDAFKRACDLLVKQYPILTTVILEENGVPRQKTQISRPCVIQEEDISTLAPHEVVACLNEKAKEPFVLDQGPLFRVCLFQRTEKETIVLFTIHHIIFDGGSYIGLIKTVLDLYRDLVAGKAPKLSRPEQTYPDYVAKERAMLEGPDGRRRLTHWREQLKGSLPRLEIPTDHPRSVSQNFKGKTYHKSISGELGARLRKFTQTRMMYLSTLFLGVFKLLLYRYSGQTDLIIGMASDERPADTEALIGFYLNMLPIRSRIRGDNALAGFLKDLQLTLVNGLAHSYPLPALVRELKIPTSNDNAPVFQVAFLYQNFIGSTELDHLQDQYRPELSMAFVDGIYQEGEYEMTLEVFEHENEFALNLKYNPDLYEASTIARMMGHYTALLETVTRNPDGMIRDCTLLTPKEERRILVDWNNTGKEYPVEKCIHDLIEHQAQKTPDKIALVYEGAALTYQELDQKSRTLAIYLRQQGIGPGSLVGICVERSLEMLVGLLGILKSGAAYVPLDPDYPGERLAYMITDSQVSMILTQAPIKDRLPDTGAAPFKRILLDQDWEKIEKRITGTPSPLKKVPSSQLAYVIYTSGSTGKPKGVMISHRALVNFMLSMAEQPGIAAHDTLLAVTTYCFDIAALELFLPLLAGARVAICPAAKTRDAAQLIREIETVKPTIMQATPSSWTMLFRAGWQNQEKVKILCGGEALPRKLHRQFAATGSDAWNMFGPTETTIWSTVKHLEKDEDVSIGKPIANTRVYILDPNLRPTAVGVYGELCIAGDGLARGYLNQPELTEQKFVENPFDPETRLYRTGDLARWLPDGNIEYSGRMDHQVKLRGFRIELEEIENSLNKHEDIEDSAVTVMDNAGHKQLVAWYVPGHGDEPVNQGRLREYLRARLPAYMVPSMFVTLNTFPLTPNGKLDRKALSRKEVPQSPRPMAPHPEKEEADLAPIEEKILGIWREALNRDDIQREDGFFDVGGDSILAVTVAERIKRRLDVEFSVTTLFKYPNINAISRHILKAKEENGLKDPLPPAGRTVSAPAGTRGPGPDDAAYPDYYQDSLAIIGISCNFPGAKDHYAFWRNLREGKEGVRFYTEEELETSGLSQAIIKDPNFVPVQSTIEGKDGFDPGFFGISPKDAAFMDPQFRLLLLHSWQAMEDAGYVAQSIPETSVFISSSNNFYAGQHTETAWALSNADEYVYWLLAQAGSIPTMISHKLGLKGASLAVHANCSSSLVGLSLAYQNIKSGQSRHALVGAANISPSSSIGYIHQPGLNFSSDGHLKAFDAAADGMIGGEGVAVILLKRALDAIADNDNIYALLRGIELNNDGNEKVGFYAPSVQGQSKVIQKALETTGVHPESIDYVEAHGTGTKLGDPVEFSALNEVYRQYTDKQQFCGIGSVKTNIGHLDTAAGLAGCIKVALSLYHKEIPPSINYKEPSPDIDLKNSPFYVVDKLKPMSGSPTPTRAALSSFGIGGTNTHALFEQYENSNTGHDNGPFLIPISARNKEQLKRYALKLVEFLKTEKVALPALAYTFQVGRVMMENRVVFIVKTMEELLDKLKAYLAGRKKVKNCITGDARRIKDTVLLFEQDEDARDMVKKWLLKGKINKIAELWVDGLNFNWEELYSKSDNKSKVCRRVPLPTYPFDKQEFKPTESKAENRNTYASLRIINTLHPLLHQNTSDLKQQQFTSIFNGKEFFLRDHVLGGSKILPGVAYLEMARVAAEISIREQTSSLRDVVWMRPIVVNDENEEVVVKINPEADGLHYEACSNKFSGKNIVYSQGVLDVGTRNGKRPPNKDIEKIKESCTSVMSSDVFYEILKNIGGNYGPGFKGIETIYRNEEEALAVLKLPQCRVSSADRYYLHPSMMDAAFQITDSLILQPGVSGGYLPFFVKEVILYNKTPSMGYAHVYFSAGVNPRDPVVKYNIDILDNKGDVCIAFKEFTARPVEKSASKASVVYLEEVWQIENIEVQEKSERKVVALFGGIETGVVEAIRDKTRLSDIGLLAGDDKLNAGERIHKNFELVFERVKKIAKSKSKDIYLILVCIPADANSYLYGPLVGLLKTANKENRKINGKLIGIDGLKESKIERILKILNAEIHGSVKDVEITYDLEDIRKVKTLTEVEVGEKDPQAGILKERGVYWITGGSGKLGMIFAKYFAKMKDVKIILSSRSSISEKREQELKALCEDGSKIEHLKCDVSEPEQVKKVVRTINEKYGSLTGILHCAGMIEDSLILNKKKNEIDRVLSPKVDGLLNVDSATRDEPLDFLVLFSSISGIFGNIGQADYAGANTFLDQFARYRNALVMEGKRRGWTLSINWPLWREGGMGMSDDEKRSTLRRHGIVPMQTSTGISALHHLLSAKKDQVLVLEGDRTQIILSYLENKPTPAIKSSGPADIYVNKKGPIAKELVEKIEKSLKHFVSDLLRLKIEDIDEEKELGEYGADSISLTTLSNKLNQAYGLHSDGRTGLVPTIFFEYPTINSFAEFLAGEYRDALENRFVEEKETGVVAEKTRGKKLTIPKKNSRFITPKPISISRTDDMGMKSEIMAITGVSGKFPMARDIDEFWKNLESGRNCISEIPPERWDWRDYYGDPSKEPNKTKAKWGGFIEDMDKFDPLFFNISPREAETMDPQQRIFLEIVWQTIEDAGYCATDLSGTKTGLFVGVGASEYANILAANSADIQAQTATGNALNILTARISHLLNLHGPSEPVDTACSSSIVAIHHAISAIRNGDCEQAIAGGINLLLSPGLFIAFDVAGMLSEDGRCKTFDSRADGYVRGEGAGAVLIKPLKKALAGGDHIYASIRGTAVNHGGRANSLTAPNVNAQADLLIDVYEKIGIDPGTVGYIEAHGTGTSLGDPVEVNALKKAFAHLYQKWGKSVPEKGTCGIGSIKTNIGHLEAAAGIAGVIKILMAIKYKQIPGSINFRDLNPYIDLDKSPFYIVKETTPWTLSREKDGQSALRRAGLSSFGFGGVNAHIVLEEYKTDDLEETPMAHPYQGPAIVVLSAKNEECLNEYVKRLLEFIEDTNDFNRNQKDYSKSLLNLAYTLQVGREAMEERLALIVNTWDQLKAKLRDIIARKENIDGLYRGQTKRNKETLSIFKGDEDLVKITETWFRKHKYAKLADLWAKGLALDWNKLYGKIKPRRISLPTYPFVRERYWIPEIEKQTVVKHEEQKNSIHPLLHQNTATLAEQRFSSSFTGEEFFFTDHVVPGQKVLPGVACLEMARVALEQSAGDMARGKKRFCLKNIVWDHPAIVNSHSAKVHICLSLEENDEIAYEIYSESTDGKDEPVIHNAGYTRFHSHNSGQTLDLERLKETCNQKILSSEQCYNAYKAMGFNYGPSHQGLARVHIGSGQVLARLKLPSNLAHTQDEYQLHPCLIDAALQATIGLPDWKVDNNQIQPLALEELEVLGHCTDDMWALIYPSNPLADNAAKFDIDLCDGQGEVCARMKGLLLNGLKNQKAAPKPTGKIGTVMLQPVWREKTVGLPESSREYSQHLVFLCEPNDIILEGVENGKHAVSYIALKTEKKEIDERYKVYARQIFETIQAVIKSNPETQVLIQIIVFPQLEKRLFAGLNGLLKTAHVENDKIIGQLLEIDSVKEINELFSKIKADSCRLNDRRIRYQDDQRYVLAFKEVEKMPGHEKIPWRDHGIYLITGGAGALGLIFAEEVARKIDGAVLILTGRSPFDKEKREKVRAIEKLGIRIDYQQVDISHEKEVIGLIKRVMTKYGALNGIVHAAGVLRDSLLYNKTNDELRDVLVPKVSGLVNLDQTTKDISLDFFILFSSMSAIGGNSGQADYAAANSFMDEYAVYRNQLVSSNKRQGPTLSINWPLWRDGGMGMPEWAEKMLFKQTGMVAMPTDVGIQALYTGVASGHDQVLVLQGDIKRIHMDYFGKPSGDETSPSIVFMLAGQGAQYVNMGRDLYEKIPKYKTIMDQVLGHVKTITGKDLKPEIYPDTDDKKSNESAQVLEISQLILFTVEYSLARLLMDGGLRPYAMIGYSFGEYIAACLAGVFNLEDALEMITCRGELLKHTKGAMLSVPCSANEVRPYLNQDLYLAIDNGISCVVSGKPAAIDGLQNALKKKRYFCVPIQVPYAIHSNLMAPILAEFETKFEKLSLKPPQIPFVSNLTGTWITAEQAMDGKYWSNHLKSTVLFFDNIQTLLEDRNDSIFIEIGPGRDLSLLVERLLGENADKRILDTLRPAHQKISDVDFLHKRIDRLSVSGVHFDTAVLGLPEERGASETSFLSPAPEEGHPAEPSIVSANPVQTQMNMTGWTLAQCVSWDLKTHVSSMLKISRDRLDSDTHLSDYGFNSILLGEFAARLNDQYFIDFTPAVFFGYPTLKKLTAYFIRNHEKTIQAFYGQAIAGKQPVLAPPAAKKAALGSVPKKSRRVMRKISATPTNALEPIAIIGMSGRFPQARNIDEMWRILVEGRTVVQEIPQERWPLEGFYNPDPQVAKTQGQSYSKWGGFIDGIDEFDPLFFQISPREAELMDPRQRMLLQESWKALEDAGYGANRINQNKIGMFVGVEPGDYQYLTRGEGGITANHEGILAARLAYFLNLRGPNMAINTACSSGLVAAHQACQALRNEECDTAIAAGVNLLVTPFLYVSMCDNGMLSVDGRCHTFGKQANGMVPGEAVAVVVLKRLSRARAENDQIYATIQGSGINYDGKTNGITAPSGVSQMELLKAVYDKYHIEPEAIEYIVAHGTGTKLGDPVEINALYDAFKAYTMKQQFCALTSNKTNLGHSFAASGIVSLINMVQALYHETIPASLHCRQENDYINWKASPFYVNKRNKSWTKKAGENRTGAVSSFGHSGTNAHMVVQSYGKRKKSENIACLPYYLLTLSAKNQEAMQAKIRDMIIYLQCHADQEINLARISYTLLVGRQHFKNRCAIVIQDYEDALSVWQQADGRTGLPNLFKGTVARDFKSQEALQKYAEDLIEQSKSLSVNKKKYQKVLYALADLYCQGYDLHWRNLFVDIPQATSIPTYPFARERYWVSEGEKMTGLNMSMNSSGSTKPVAEINRGEYLFDQTFYGQLIDEVIEDTISVEDAVNKANSLIYNGD